MLISDLLGVLLLGGGVLWLLGTIWEWSCTKYGFIHAEGNPDHPSLIWIPGYQLSVVVVVAGSQDSRPFVNPKNWSRRRQSPYFINHGAVMAMRNLQIGAESQGLGVRIKALNSKGDTRMRALMSQGKTLSGKRVRFIAAVGVGYASKTAIRRAAPLSGGQIHKERYGAGKRK